MSPGIVSKVKSRRLPWAGRDKDKKYVGDFSVVTSRNTTYKTEN